MMEASYQMAHAVTHVTALCPVAGVVTIMRWFCGSTYGMFVYLEKWNCYWICCISGTESLHALYHVATFQTGGTELMGSFALWYKIVSNIFPILWLCICQLLLESYLSLWLTFAWIHSEVTFRWRMGAKQTRLTPNPTLKWYAFQILLELWITKPIPLVPSHSTCSRELD